MNYDRDKMATIAAYGKIEDAEEALMQVGKEQAFTDEFCSVAAENGNCEMVKWAILEGATWRPDVWVRLEGAGVSSENIKKLNDDLFKTLGKRLGLVA